MVWRCLFIMLLAAGTNVAAADAKIIKVLPHLLDDRGRHTLSPSLYERDAYQLHLRESPELISALRFDIQYRAPAGNLESPVMRIEIRGSGPGISKAAVFENPVPRTRFFAKWAAIQLTKDDFEKLGEIIAWRVTLWDGGFLVAEHESFLW